MLWWYRILFIYLVQDFKESILLGHCGRARRRWSIDNLQIRIVRLYGGAKVIMHSVEMVLQILNFDPFPGLWLYSTILSCDAEQWQ